MPDNLQVLAIGSKIANRYQILNLAGQGGMASIYRVKDLETNQIVALKYLQLNNKMNPREREGLILRFENEARTMSFLQHPAIMQVFDSFVLEGQYFMIMEFIDGMNLHAFMSTYTPTIRQVLNYIEYITEALEYAHNHHVVHRDIKPENIMITREGTAKLLDFGIAKFEFSSQVTTDGTLLGTVAYMSPEQLQSSKNTNHQSDIYSLGLVLYEIFTGKLPFEAATPGAAVVQIFSQEPVSPYELNPTIGPDLEQVILTCIQKHPQYRFASCRQLQHWLQILQETEISPVQRMLPRIRPFQEFRVAEVLSTLITQQVSGECWIWNSFEEIQIYFENGDIQTLRSRQNHLSPYEAFCDLICWDSGNFCFFTGSKAVENLFAAISTDVLLQDARANLSQYRQLWLDYHDDDLPETIMMPGKKDIVSPVCQDLLNSIDGMRCIGQLYPLLEYDRLSVLNGLKELEDRQFIFLERQRSGIRVIGRN